MGGGSFSMMDVEATSGEAIVGTGGAEVDVGGRLV